MYADEAAGDGALCRKRIIAEALEQEIIETLKPRQLEFGAAGRLLASKELAAVLPLDDAELLDRAKPVAEGKVRLDPERIARRREGQVKRLLDNGPFGLVVLGGGHDLSEAVRRWSATCEYLRVWVRRWPE
jgi:hypothetical protein